MFVLFSYMDQDEISKHVSELLSDNDLIDWTGFLE